MKPNINILVFALLFANFQIFKFSNCLAQVPQKFNYQGIARDAKGNPMAKQPLALKLSVLPTSDATTPEYEEVQQVLTNEFGLYTLQIGNGTAITGDMKTVKWETGNKYIKVMIDSKGGNDFVDAGTTQLLSVPYAIYADKAGTAKNAGGGDRLGAVSTSASGTGTVNYLTKFTAANTIYNSQLFDNGTNIGIGTTSPAARLHLYSNLAGVQQQIRMQNASTTGASRFRMDNDGTLSYATFSKYGSAYASGYPGIPALYPYANLLAFGNNGLAADDGLGRFLISNGGNIGLSIFKGGASKLKFHADYATENVGIGGNASPVSRVHLNNTDGTSMDLRLTNTTTGHTTTDGMTITMSGNNATINNRENSSLAFATNNTERLRISATGDVGIGTTSPTAKFDVNGQIRIQGGAPGIGKVLTSDSTGLASWQNPGASIQWANNGTHIYNNNSGNVGIGTNSPSKKLEVNGDALINGLTIGRGGGNDTLNTAIGSRALSSNTTGVFNTANGRDALSSNTTGEANTANGDAALYSNTTGQANTANGNSALSSNTIGNYNTANGSSALFSNTTGEANTANGISALQNNTTGNYNTANGSSALYANTIGFGNTANGNSALYSNTTGNFNTANGNSALYSNTTGNANTANGVSALQNNTTGINNTANGVSALISNTTGNANTANGRSVLRNNTTGNRNVGIGDSAGFSQSVYENSTFIGTHADASVSGLTNATAIGANAIVGASNSMVLGSANVNVGIGTSTPTAKLDVNGQIRIQGGSPGTGKVLTSDATGLASWQNPSASSQWANNGTHIYNNNSGNVGIGTNSPSKKLEVNGDALINGLTIGRGGGNDTLNTAIGSRALSSNTTGVFNTAIGSRALSSNTTGVFNTANGRDALYSNTTGQANTANGDLVLYSNTTGNFNNANGVSALYSNTTGSVNTANGNVALYSNTTGNFNTANGVSALFQNTTGSRNVGLGDSAGSLNQVYNSCTFLGTHADASLSGLTNATAIGANAIVGASNSMVLGSANVNVGIGTSTPTFQLHLSTNSAAKPTSSTWTISSDARLKTVDGTYTRGLADVLKLNTVKYHYNNGNARNLPTEEQGYGFVAQELQQVYPEAVKENADGYLSVDFHPVLVSYINAFKEQQLQIDDLKKQTSEIELLKKQNELLMKRLEALEKK